MKSLKLLITALFIASISVAQTTLDTTIKTINLESVNVTGTRADETQPITNMIIKSSEIKEDYHGEEMTFILAKTPSITTQSDGGHEQGYTTFRLRGIDQTRLNFTLNGVPLNEPEDQGVYFSNYPSFANSINSIQVQRGVGTTANGTSSYGGSVNFESNTGYVKGTEINLGYGSFNTTMFSASHNTGLIANNKLSIFGNASVFSTDGYKDHSGNQGYSFFLGSQYYGNRDFLKLTAFSGFSNNQMSWLAVSETDINKNPKTNYNSELADDNFRQSMVQLQYSRKVGNKSLLSTTLYYNRLDGEWDLDLESLGAGTDILNYQLSSNFYGGMLNYKIDADNFRFNIGTHANTYTRTHGMAIIPDTKDLLYTNKGTKPSVSGFAKTGVDVGKFSLFLDLELRYTQFSYVGAVNMEPINWLFFNPKGGVVFKATDKTKVYFSVGKSHREPTRTDMFGGGDDLVTFNTFKAEEVIDYELGTNSNLSNRLRFDGNLYYMSFKNEITLLGALGSNGLPLMVNVDKSFRSGVELALTYKLSKSFTTRNTTTLAMNRIYNTDLDNKTTITSPLYSPWLVVNQELTYKRGRVFVTLEGVYNSVSYIDFENKYTTPAFLVLKSTVGYSYDGLALSVRLNNLTNVKYFTNGYAIDGEKYFFVNAPFSAFANLKITF